MNKIITNALRITLNIGPKSNYKAGLKLGIDLHPLSVLRA